MKLTQPVLLQSFEDEFELPEGKSLNTSAVPGEVLRSRTDTSLMSGEMQMKYRSGTGKLLHLMKWSRPDVLNSVSELSHFMIGAMAYHLKVMYHVMQYCLVMKQKGLTLKPDCKWDGDPNFEFTLAGKSDSTYASDEEAKSVTGYYTTLNGAIISYKSKGQTATTLSVTESELVAAVDHVQDLLFERRVLESIGWRVQLPMILNVDNRGVVDLVNNWSVTGRTQHITVLTNFLRELKEENIIRVE